MPVTIVPTPPNPVVSKGVQITFGLTTGNYVRVWCSAAPPGSKLQTTLDSSDTPNPRVEIFANESISSSPPFVFKPEKPGRYQLAAQEYQRGASSYGGGYAGDPKGFDSEGKIGGESSIELDFGTKVTVQMGVAPDTATLVLYVFGGDIGQTTFALHGEVSPAIVDPKTPVARNAATQLQANAQVLAGLTATAAVGNIDAMIDSMAGNFSGHFGDTTGGIHASADSYNAIGGAFANPVGKKPTVTSVSELLVCLTQHMKTDQARRVPYVSAGQGSGDWHDLGSGSVVDGANLPITPAPTDMASAYVALADLFDAFEAHRFNLTVHGVPDLVHTLTAPPPLMILHAAFLTILRTRVPTPAPTENPGVPVLINGAGFKES